MDVVLLGDGDQHGRNAKSNWSLSGQLLTAVSSDGVDTLFPRLRFIIVEENGSDGCEESSLSVGNEDGMVRMVAE